MTTFVALLRGINVSGQRRIAMVDLKLLLEGLGLEEVRTYVQSGNAVFGASADDPAGLASAIRGRIARDLGHDVAVLVLSAGDMARMAGSNPFLSLSGVDQKWLHATFLFAKVSPSAFGALDLPARQQEQARLVDGVVYLSLPNGYGRTRLNNAYFEKALGTAATTRNWKTVRALADLSVQRQGPGNAPSGAEW